eukprot:CAMPEP_0180493514 /NCGR_PEP_ID=MMETSP1036_2-20121128/40749_1 /TAXON_ID=632150 /ORGANISM="Azadinium spinosum, Strain 3D9" /LENGTH=55 /DNA_ID=CAMNT_0022501899 /DNA_START=329 /DNA_END=492 /DNA_ORIENTATION=+
MAAPVLNPSCSGSAEMRTQSAERRWQSQASTSAWWANRSLTISALQPRPTAQESG